MNIKDNNPNLWISSFPQPSSLDHKYTRGMVLVNCGPKSKTGAARLAARSALRVGAGAVKIICNENVVDILEPQISVELIEVINNKQDFQNILKDKKVSSILVGPGNGINNETKARALMALAFIDHVVLDADALTVFENNPEELFIDCYPHTILTPHEGEFKKIFGHEIAKIDDRVLKTKEASIKSNTIVVLKGANTIIASPNGDVVINKSSAAYLATAGSGDVLAGIITSLVGKNKMNAFDAACAGVWLHSEIGKILGAGMIAEDIIDLIPVTVKKLLKMRQ
ncbi:NAD(P)H-hydrate dehydratase [Pelagibacteraceae bacterium]|nr:NAD(P)H-hydrate dehydratase [Pelagibacteraceae bacterium]